LGFGQVRSQILPGAVPSKRANEVNQSSAIYLKQSRWIALPTARNDGL
jgi:hypothetical protein